MGVARNWLDPGAGARDTREAEVGIPQDLAPLAVILASDHARYITGQIIWVDGGLTSQISSVRR